MKAWSSFAVVSVLTAGALAAACNDGASDNLPTGNGPTTPAGPSATGSAPATGGTSTTEPPDVFDVPLAGVTSEQLTVFNKGDDLFDLPLRDADGLGPLYTRTSCGDCHTEATRGPGVVQKMSVADADGVTPAADQSKLPYGHTVHPLVAGGGKTPIVPPTNDPTVKVTSRTGPPVLGRGYIEAVLDSEIERVAAEQAQRTDGIHGKVNHVIYASQLNAKGTVHQHKAGDVVIGRFGLKARVGFLDDFTADALQGDMGITSPLRPDEIANPDGLTDDHKPGVDVTLDSVNFRADYVRLIAIPRRRGLTDHGKVLFDQAKCSVCHVPTMHTRSDYPIAQLAGVDAPIYTDILLHDLGDDLADGTGGIDGEATSRQWRTAPLIGLRFVRNYMHDSRSHTIEDAVHAHAGNGSEANETVQIFDALSDADRAELLAWVGAL